jgi:hypothetical protein
VPGLGVRYGSQLLWLKADRPHRHRRTVQPCPYAKWLYKNYDYMETVKPVLWILSYFFAGITDFPGLWIRIYSMRIWIQHFSSIWIRIQAKTKLSKTISFSNLFEIKISVKSNKKYRCYSSNFFQKVVIVVLCYTFLVVNLKKISKIAFLY